MCTSTWFKSIFLLHTECSMYPRRRCYWGNTGRAFQRWTMTGRISIHLFFLIFWLYRQTHWKSNYIHIVDINCILTLWNSNTYTIQGRWDRKVVNIKIEILIFSMIKSYKVICTNMPFSLHNKFLKNILHTHAHKQYYMHKHI